MEDSREPSPITPEKQEILARMARRKGRKLRAKANSKKALRTWAEYSGATLEPTGSFSQRGRWIAIIAATLVIIGIGVMLASLTDTLSLSRQTSQLDEVLGTATLGLIIIAGALTALVVLYTFLRAVLNASDR